MSVYWDTSCLLKLYCRESDSEKYLKLMENSTVPLFTSSLTITELYFALLQKEIRSETGSEKAKELYREFETDLSQSLVFQIPLEKKHFTEARKIADTCNSNQPPLHLRSLDGLHLATALHAHCLSIVTTDHRMKAAASLLGLIFVEA